VTKAITDIGVVARLQRPRQVILWLRVMRVTIVKSSLCSCAMCIKCPTY